MMTSLGKLEPIDLRKAWQTEAGDFTPWLAQEENLALLSDTIGIDLELEAQEKSGGPFRADILCKDTGTGHWVLIENQLERTDHTHLGQLLTYAAGLKAVTIVWIADQFTEEHRAALDWLNEITDDRFNFFGLEIELWKIGDSPVAPKFNVVGTVRFNPQKYYISIKNPRNVAFFVFRKKKLHLTIPLPVERVNEQVKQNTVKRLSDGVQRFWGSGRSWCTIIVSSPEALPEVVEVLKIVLAENGCSASKTKSEDV